MKATKAVLVQVVEGSMVASEFAIENLEAAMEVRGYKVSGYKGSIAPGSQRISYREEMIGQPIFSGLCGPMYGGEGVVRYEDSGANDRLSA